MPDHIEWLKEQVARQQERAFLWLPVFLSFGIAFYYALLSEPPLIMGLTGIIFAGFAIWLVRRRALGRIFVMFLFLIAAGFFAAQGRTFLSDTPLLHKKLEPVTVTGTIESIEKLEGEKGSRLILTHLEIERLLPEYTPRKIRLSVRKDEGFGLGQRIRVLAALNPPSPPVMPGAFDFQRYMYFQGIGGLGFAYKQPEILKYNEPGGYTLFIETLRTRIDNSIDAALPPARAAIAKALITGKRAAISKEDDQAIKDAGIYHILSISGLHITLFATIIFFTSRFLMACVPSFALRHPIKKYAAVLGFLGALFYTLLAGAEIPAQRSLLMLGTAFLAILLDRDPLSPRLLAFAALVVLLLAPESLLSISFQMSFAAVAAMIFFYDWQRERISNWYSQTGPFRRILLYFGGIAMTTILATFATAPFTIFHFQTLSLYGIIANGLVIPLTGFIIMPFAVLALFLMPFGLAVAPLQLVGFGVDLMVGISYWVAALPHATLHFASWPGAGFIILVLAILFFMLWHGPLKYAALLPGLVALGMIGTYRQPDILISPKFDLVAVRGENGLLISSLRKEKFIRENWERMAGFLSGSSMAWPKEGGENNFFCDDAACRTQIAEQKISFVKAPEIAPAECDWADLVLSFARVKTACNTILIDKFDAYHNGAYAIWLAEGKLVIKTVEEGRGARPWNEKSKKYQ
ncbi:MAG: ComEC/Rec2 family competence protein [Alphaproteobacteria bacterium]